MEGLLVDDITTAQDVIRVSGTGSTGTVSDATFTSSSVQRVRFLFSRALSGRTNSNNCILAT